MKGLYTRRKNAVGFQRVIYLRLHWSEHRLSIRYLQQFVLTQFCCRSFREPKPDYRAVADDVSTFVAEVARSLKLGVNRSCSFSGLQNTQHKYCCFLDYSCTLGHRYAVSFIEPKGAVKICLYEAYDGGKTY